MNRLPTRLLHVFSIALAGLLLLVNEAPAQRGLDLENDTLTQSVLIHPPIDATGDSLDLSTGEHEYKSQLRLADQLGRDFVVEKLCKDGIGRAYRPGSRGTQNKDWYGWRRDALAPFKATVARVAEPDTVNVPGTMNRDAQPGFIVFEDASDNVTVLYAHVREISVEKGDTVRPGEVVGKVGNNGNSRNPHLHIGAWKGPPSKLGNKTGTPLQIQVDLYAEERDGNGSDSQ